MPGMTDPMNALRGLQLALDQGLVQLQPCEFTSELGVLMDEPTPGSHRISYARVVGGVVQSLAMFVQVEPYQKTLCFNLGYAVLEEERGKGLATQVVIGGIAELQNGLKKAMGLDRFYVEALVSIDNEPSNRLASKVLSDQPKSVTDGVSKQPALQYMKLCAAGADEKKSSAAKRSRPSK